MYTNPAEVGIKSWTCSTVSYTGEATVCNIKYYICSNMMHVLCRGTDTNYRDYCISNRLVYFTRVKRNKYCIAEVLDHT